MATDLNSQSVPLPSPMTASVSFPTPPAHIADAVVGTTPPPTTGAATATATVPPASTAATTPPATTAAQGTSFPLPNGGSISVDASGNPLSVNGKPFSIDTGKVDTGYFDGGGMSLGTVHNTRNDYATVAAGLASAYQFSPDYLSAYQKSQTLGAQEAQMRGNLATGNVGGDTQGYAEGFTNRALMGADAQKAFADISLAAQQMIRQGNIQGAQALVDAYKPQSVGPGSSLVSPVNGQVSYGGTGAYSDYQAQQTYFNLAQTFPDAQIPAYDPSASAQQNLQNAQALAARAPSFQSRNLVQVQLPGGGISFVNRNQMQTKPDGSLTIVTPAEGAQADAYKKTIEDLTTQKAAVSRAITTADSNFPLLLDAVKKAGVNDFNAPLGNQLQQAVNNKVIGSGDYAYYQTVLTSLQQEYAQILSRGGSVTNMTRQESDGLVSGSLGINALKKVYGALQAESGNVIKGYDSELKNSTDGLNKIYSGSSFNNSTAGANNSSTDTTTIGSSTFEKVNGQWVVKK